MKIEIFTLCDAATNSDGKLNILGSFSHIFGKEAPITHPLCALAIKLRFEKIEQGSKRLRISFVNADGKPVIPTLEQTFTVNVHPNESTANVNLVLLIQQLKLENFGDYSIDLAIDGRLEGAIPLAVRQRPQK
ncbi:MAG: DUF6941 family protein [Candidatus Anammoxibacter sp.]